MAGPFTISNLDALTNKYWIPKLVDNFFLRGTLLTLLKNSEKTYDGGRVIRQPISYRSSPNAGAWGGGMDTLPTNYQDHVTDAEFAITNYFATVTLPQTEQWANMGKAKLIDLMDSQMTLAEESLADTLGQDVYGDGSNNANGKKRMDGLSAICTNAADPSIGAYGGITRVGASGSKAAPVGNAFWNANVFASNANATVTTWKSTEVIDNVTTISIKKMQQMFGMCSMSGETPTHILAGQLGYNAYFNLLTSTTRQVQYNDDKTGKAGYSKGLEFNGIGVYVDDLIDSQGKMYFVNMDHIFFRPHSTANFYTTPFRSPSNQLANIKIIALMGNITCDKPQQQGVITGITG